MNRLRCCVIFSLILLGRVSSLSAQHYATRENYLDDPKIFGTNALSFNLGELMQFGFEFSYERKITDKQWVSISPAYYGFSSYTEGEGTDIYFLRGFGTRLEHRYYPWNDTRHKQALFLSYGAQYQHFDITSKNRIESNIHRYSLNCQIGYRKILGNVFFLEVFAGIGASFVQRIDSPHGIDAEVADYTSFFGGYARKGPKLQFGISMGAVL